CHQVVPERDFVFARPVFDPIAPAGADGAFLKSFATTARQSLGKTGQRAFEALRQQEPTLQSIGLMVREMPLFAGSISESKPPLVAAARRDRALYLLVDEKSDQFLATAPSSRQDCKN